ETSFFVSSSWISLRNLLSTTARGALPGRYPGIFAKRAKLLAIASHSFATSSAGNSICSFETEPGCCSTSTFIVNHCSCPHYPPQNLQLVARDLVYPLRTGRARGLISSANG